MLFLFALRRTRVLALSIGLLAGCQSAGEISGDYVPLIQEPDVAESVRVARNHQFHYHYRRGATVFDHSGTWELETRQGHEYLVLRYWQDPHSRCGLNRAAVASFEREGDQLWLIKDLPDCAWRKLSTE
ncbi:hypothetical protein [Hymenobacter psychrophilus]|uniref:Lipoprotein n=1 Tax=Hymenobacter psychrophilus TaxID=651662 RepID=A0A1H3MWZ4_9BACT|nr:hypothetical protein [Hymenobacter psychrophilus]SDY81014.1 hypothetical protein SAMN04488069_11438 [Hymenobacter psychrophilus]